MESSLYLTQDVFERLLAHAVRDYPTECCGILVGCARGPHIHADRAIAATNISTADQRSSYQIDWHTLFATVRALRAPQAREAIVGFYHSHPDGSAQPSQRDLDAAWYGYSYVIVSMLDGWCSSITSWHLKAGGDGFQRQPVLLP